MSAVNLWQVNIAWSASGGDGVDSVLVNLDEVDPFATSSNYVHALPHREYFLTAPAVRAVRAALDHFETKDGFERRIKSIVIEQTATTLVKAS